MLAVINQTLEHRADARQLLELRLDLLEPCAGDAPDRGTIGAVVQTQQLANFIEGEPELLGAFDEENSMRSASSTG